MNNILWADRDWTPVAANPFSPDGTYGPNWSAFVYGEEQPYYSNVWPGSRVYVLSVNPQIDIHGTRLRDFADYENAHGRTVIVRAPAAQQEQAMAQFHPSLSGGSLCGIREHDPRYLVHSTTLESWTAIKRTGALLSPAELRRRQCAVHEIGLKALLEPADYSDYIMLDVLEGCGEIVVNSRQLGFVCTDPSRPYTPGVRLYFDSHRLISDGLAVRDGLHVLKVKDCLPLRPYMLMCIGRKMLPQREVWTPTTYTDAANSYFLEQV
ncbi:hypothetical protein [Paenibacillus tepidiphilus]|uniref:hypothetical protein n=1 Tax=Paenibacillus tepidiphilus TaxID=2608683 RepID=UPI00193CDF14|nr:hypothetical protein [Paenibacillus tepidiphilus]